MGISVKNIVVHAQLGITKRQCEILGYTL